MRPGIGHSLIPSLSTRSRWIPTNAISAPGITNTWSAKKRDSVAAAMIGPPSKTQDLTGESHPERHQEQKDSHDPGELPRVFVGAEEEHLHHVNRDNREHEVRAPAMQSSNEPAD